jgi:pimeloyl-ACP methyl ester carboxylesterase
MQFTSEVSEFGVTERGFELEVNGERVSGIIWAPEGAKGPRPLLLMGHGGTQHKRTEGILARARAMVRHHAYAVVAIDAPAHGDRVTPDQAAAARQARAAGGAGMTPARFREMAARNAKAVAEWKAALDAVEALDYVGQGPVGYWGVSMGTAIGVPFLAAEPRVRAAVLGLAGIHTEEFEKAARSITIPLIFMCQWNDEVAPRDASLALYDAFGSAEKSMHANPGGHLGIPPFERELWERFYLRHLGPASS